MNTKTLETDLEVEDYFPIVDALLSDFIVWYFIKRQTILSV